MLRTLIAPTADVLGLNIYLIRHCESMYNQIYQSYLKQNKSRLQIEEEIQYNENYIDCSLTDKGIKQAQQMKRKLKDKRVGTVFVSPYIRTLQTCKIMFQDHPDNPKVVVHPFFGEQLGWSCDISKYNGKAFPGFENYDWRFMPKSQTLDDYWLIQRKKNVTQIKELVKNSNNFNDLISNCCKLMKYKKYNNSLEETKYEITDRSDRSKRFLTDMKEIYDQPFYIVSHCSFFMNFTTYFNTELGYHENLKLLNGECKKFSLQI